MNTSKSKYTFAIIAIYLIAVIICIFNAFDFAGDISFNWMLGLIGLTLPWSLVSILFVWSLIHGAGLGFFSGMYFVFATLNSLIFYWLRTRSGRSQTA